MMSSMRGLVLVAVVLVAAAGWVTPGAAAAAGGVADGDPDEEVARRHLDRGRALAAGGHCDQAIDELQRGRVIKPLPELALALGRCYDTLDDRPHAVSWYRSYLKTAPDDADHGAARGEARARLTALGPELAAAHEEEAPPPRDPSNPAWPRRARIAGPAVAGSGVLLVGIGGICEAFAHAAAQDLEKGYDPAREHDRQIDRALAISFFAIGGAAVVAGGITWLVGWKKGRSAQVQ
jgi:hypothetical protein